LLPRPCSQRCGGRPRASDCKVLEGILWILRSGARWQDLPEEFPSPATCWHRLRDWEEQGVRLKIWQAFVAELNQRKQLQLLQWSESYLDGSFAPAKKLPREKLLRLIADRGHDSDPLRKRLAERGTELIAPLRWNRSKPVTQDGRDCDPTEGARRSSAPSPGSATSATS